MFITSVNDLRNTLDLTLGSINAGNNHPKLRNRATALVDKLEQMGEISTERATKIQLFLAKQASL